MRMYIFGENALSYSQMKSLRHIGTSGLIQSSQNLDILWELKPKLDTQFKFSAFKTNSQGLRDKEYSKVKSADTFRIAVIGDSFTMGEGVEQQDIYHEILEQRFNALEDTRNFEFINFGVAGYSLVQYISTIKRKALEYKPDAIFIGFCAANDSKLPNLEAFKKPYQVKPVSNGFFHLYSMELLGDVYKKYYNKARGRFSGYNVDAQYVDERFKELREISESSNIPVIIAYIDNKSASADFNIISDLAKKYQFEFIDGTSNLPKQTLPENMIYLTDAHPNAKANQIIADTLFPQLFHSSIIFPNNT